MIDRRKLAGATMLPEPNQIAFRIGQGAIKMNDKLKPLVDAARRVEMTPQDRETQRISFAYGNTAIENERITRDMIQSEAQRLTAIKTDGKEQ
jgi:hypothetical protein